MALYVNNRQNIVHYVECLSLVRLPLQVQGILFRKIGGETEYLLLKTTPQREDFWQPVTGGLEEGETEVEALKREVSEETGIKNFVRIVENVDYFEYPDAHFIKGYDFIKEYVFGVEVDPNERIVIDGKEHSQFRWCSFQEALQLLKWDENKKALSELNEILSSKK
jgi:8-oxo-dGTP pyrophosphatase MutT (NUDIX family)